jgi:Uma2 family endonuclease
MIAYTIDLNSVIQMTDDQFYDLCRANPEIKFERSAQGELIIMAPTGGKTGNFNFELSADFAVWNRQTRLGVGFDSSTCFKLPKGGNRSPDVAWIRQERWDTLTFAQRTKFPPICPDFVLELCAPTDLLKSVQAKLAEYLDNGAQLGWLINPQDRQVEIYRPDRPVEVLHAPATISGDPVLPGFILNLAWLWG